MKLLAVSLLVLLQTVPLSSTQAKGASIEGIVTRVGSDEPIAGAQLTLTGVAGVAPRTSIPSTTTDSSGRFSLRDVEAGTYKLAVMSNGYARSEYGQRQPGIPGAPIVLAAGEDLKNLSIRLTPAGTISGHIRSLSGKPLPGIPVQLVRRIYNARGQRISQSAGMVRTNDRGEYRFYWITPGRYYVVAGQGNMRDLARTDQNRNETTDQYPYTFFPGVNEFEKAADVEIQSGASLDAIDFNLPKPQRYRISGRVVDSATGLAPRQAVVTLTYWSPNGGSSSSSTGPYNAKTGTIEFTEVVPGSYSISLVAYEGTGLPGAAFQRRTADSSVATNAVVASSDVDLGLLTIVPPHTVNGQIKVEGPVNNSITMGSFRVSLLTPLNTDASSMVPPVFITGLPIQGNGTFTGYSPHDSLRVSMSGMPPGFYVREARLNGVDALADIAPLSNANELVVTLSSRGGEITGVVQDERMQPTAGVQAVLVPNANREYPEFFQDVTSDQNGRFRFTGIAPGDYKLFAWESLERYSYFDPQVLEKYEQNGQPVHIAESSHETLNLKMIAARGE